MGFTFESDSFDCMVVVMRKQSMRWVDGVERTTESEESWHDKEIQVKSDCRALIAMS